MIAFTRNSAAVIALLFAVLLIPAVYADEGPLDRTIAKIRSAYGELLDLKADFEMKNTVKSMGRTEESTGVVYFRAPNQMRWDYCKPEGKKIVSDGHTLWMYIPEERRVYMQKVAQTYSARTPFEFLFSGADLKKDFRLALEKDAEAEQVVRLEPKTSSAGFQSLRIMVNGTTGQIQASELTDFYGNLTEIRFSNVKTNTNLKEGLFTFAPMDGVEVVPVP